MVSRVSTDCGVLALAALLLVLDPRWYDLSVWAAALILHYHAYPPGWLSAVGIALYIIRLHIYL